MKKMKLMLVGVDGQAHYVASVTAEPADRDAPTTYLLADECDRADLMDDIRVIYTQNAK